MRTVQRNIKTKMECEPTGMRQSHSSRKHKKDTEKVWRGLPTNTRQKPKGHFISFTNEQDLVNDLISFCCTFHTKDFRLEQMEVTKVKRRSCFSVENCLCSLKDSAPVHMKWKVVYRSNQWDYW